MKVFIFFIGVFCLVQHQILAVEFPSYQKSIPKNTYEQLILDLVKAQTKVYNLKSTTLNVEQLIALKLEISSLKELVLKARKDTKLGKDKLLRIGNEWDNLTESLGTLDDKLIVPARIEIEAFFSKKNDDDRLLGIDKYERVAVLYGIIEQVYVICEKGVPSKNEDYNKLTELVALEKDKLRIDQGKNVKIDFELEILHYSKRIDFYKKENLIEKIEQKTAEKIQMVLSTRADLIAFKESLNVSFDAELKRYFRQLNCILGKQEKHASPLNLALGIYFKKVKENNRIGWIIDVDKTIAPAKLRKDTIVTLVCESTVTFPYAPVLSSSNFIREIL